MASRACRRCAKPPAFACCGPPVSDDPNRQCCGISWLAHGIEWIEDPSNHDLHATRPQPAAPPDRSRCSHRRPPCGRPSRQRPGCGNGMRGRHISRTGLPRATIRPEGFAVLSRRAASASPRCPGQPDPGHLGPTRIQPAVTQIADLAAQTQASDPSPVSVCSRPPAASGEGLLLIREEAAIGEPVSRRSRGAVWDNRFRITACPGPGRRRDHRHTGRRDHRHAGPPAAATRFLGTIRLCHLPFCVHFLSREDRQNAPPPYLI